MLAFVVACLIFNGVVSQEIGVLTSSLSSGDVPVIDPVECVSVTLEGCICRPSWSVDGDEYTQCSNPDNREGDWCAVEVGCYGTPAGKFQEGRSSRSFGFCPVGGCVDPSCLTALSRVSDISTFVKIAQATNVIGMIAGTTVLAPTNAALDPVVASLGLDLDNLTNDQLQTLLDVLKLHVISGFQLTSADLGILEEFPLLAEEQFVSVATGTIFTIVGTTASTTVVEELSLDILCNVAVFVVDSVLTV
eukprot:TRINITY_DN22706_c0_g1_i1.p1 TRINITY_DN22706_c0_g1~~TRINITY_DN22706_c0_g1_i1.p1  ORF type:complete len:275 (-),score=30.09 TRINITY_DN22706_c0_g1_i1:279-1022(-)